MTFDHHLIDEPRLEFGGRGCHVDPRIGLLDYGPLQVFEKDTISIGVIGTAETFEGFDSWMNRLKSPIVSKSSKQRNLFPPFPGLDGTNPFRCNFSVTRRGRRLLSTKQIEKIVATSSPSQATKSAATLFADEADAMLTGTHKPDVIVVALPLELTLKVVNNSSFTDSDIDDQCDDASIDFHDLFKAKVLHLRCPTQIVLPSLWDDHVRIPHKLKHTMRSVQDPATRAWNLLTALFYKAGGTPWRLPRSEGRLQTNYIGVGFYRDLSGKKLFTSTSQMFEERGKGLILRGGTAHTDRGAHPYLDRTDSYDLLRRSLKVFFGQHHHHPARLVILKTSPYQHEEADGFREAIEEANIAFSDLVWISKSPITMYRDGEYPALRGTVVNLDKQAIVFTRGSVPLYRTYPGPRMPIPLFLRPYLHDTPITDLATDVLALTKMNWNSTQFDGALPIPILAARKVGRVLKHVSLGERDAVEYRYFM